MFFGVLAGSLAVLGLLVRRHIFSIFDPMFYFVLSQSIGVAVTIYTWNALNFRADYLLLFLLNTACLIAGIVVFKPRAPRPIPIDRVYLQVLAFLFLGALVSINGYVALTSGLAIFSDDPQSKKALFFESGLVRRFSVVISTVGVFPVLLLLFSERLPWQRFLYSGMLSVYVLAGLLSGSKGGILTLIFKVFFVSLLVKTPRGFKNLTATAIAAAGVAGLLFVLSLTSLARGEATITDLLLTRMVAEGDVYYYAFGLDLIPALEQRFGNFLTYITNDLTSFLRLTEHSYNIGGYIFYLLFGIYSGFGPNSHNQVEGIVFFKQFSWLYSFGVGLLIGFVRYYALRYIKNTFGVMLWLSFVVNITFAAVDINLFSFLLTNELIIIVPILAGSYYFSKLLPRKTAPLPSRPTKAIEPV
ncbi:hypothetical protein [Gloeobacter morelensis]|uniref:Oligosaccharide repeat unit polymerase n=1 Tax=Gloeobacter morelensis MG652769 TaxID=2781736 RepID=A0ABY3PQK7_9CYAN|nr:hypothetical protein [Gloeobacter morelensis]UFP95971.1 hypothetical protein ISF26_07065 [Gloeobacter morelensis MG652769]